MSRSRIVALAVVAGCKFADVTLEQQRAYPWSNPPGDLATLDGSHASYSPDSGANCIGDGMPGCALTDLVFVGSKPTGDGRWGQSDLAGNLYEWALDWYSATYVKPCMDCANLTPASTRVLRGGSFLNVATDVRTDHRGNFSPTYRGSNFGVRCARTP